MLPAAHRITRGEDFRHAVRSGRRQGGRWLVLHLALPDRAVPDDAASPARVGLVVSRAVGPAVTRNRVKRRLRHLLRPRLAHLPPASLLVVRALPAAAAASSAQLARDVDRALDRLGVVRVPAGSPVGSAREAP